MTEIEKNEVRKAMDVITSVSKNDLKEFLETTEYDMEKLLSFFTVPYDDTVKEKRAMEKRVANILHQLGIPSHIKGYKYITACVCLVIEDKTYIDHVTTRLYVDVAEQYTTTQGRVERAIRHAIGVAFERGNKKLFDVIFGTTIDPKKIKPTNKEFICRIYEIVGELK